MQVRVALTETRRADSPSNAFVIAWPLDNDPAHVNSGTAAAIQAEVGGLPVVVVALAANGELRSHGRGEHVRPLIEAGLDGHAWVMFDVELQPPRTGVAKLHPRKPNPPERLAA